VCSSDLINYINNKEITTNKQKTVNANTDQNSLKNIVNKSIYITDTTTISDTTVSDNAVSDTTVSDTTNYIQHTYFENATNINLNSTFEDTYNKNTVEILNLLNNIVKNTNKLNENIIEQLNSNKNSLLDSLISFNKSKDNKIDQLQNDLEQKNKYLKMLHENIDSLNSTIKVKLAEIDDLNNYIGLIINNNKIDNDNNLKTLKNDIATSLKSNYCTFMEHINDIYSEEMFESFKSTIKRLFIILNTHGIDLKQD
jgi:hypothetical protein